jgi:hypothetical protein
MLPRIGCLIAGAATSAFRGLGASQAVIAMTPAGPPAIAHRFAGTALVLVEIVLIRIDININLSR